MNVSPYKRFEKAIKASYLKPLAFLRYGSSRPAKARLHGRRNWIHIDPDDPCAIKKVVHEPLRGRVSDNLVFWRDFNRHLKPGLVVDVGLNYGECLFGDDYAPGSRLYGFEANPRLIPFLEKSRADHPDGGRMTLTHCLVSDTSAEGIPFFVNPDWSGSSSAVRQLNDRPESLEFRLDAKTLDSVIPEDAARNATLLFKMDIEGYESRAIKGFARTLRTAARAIGFIEFDDRLIRWAGEEPDAYLTRLREDFEVFRPVSIKSKTLRPVGRFEDLPKIHSDSDHVHVDLVLVAKQTPAGWTAPEWTVLP